MKNRIVKLRIFLWLILAGIVGWLLYMAVSPSGKISYVYDFSKDNYFISRLTPKERIVETQNFASARIIGDPVYFTLRVPRRFDKAKLILKYKRQDKGTEPPIGNSVPLPIIEAGILADKKIWRYDLQPVENKIIDQLAMAWDVISEEGTMLLQREKKYNSIDEFFRSRRTSLGLVNNLPARNEIALYNYNLQQEFLLKDYEPYNVGIQDFASMQNFAPLRGPYQFYTYIKNEDLDFTFIFQDLNKNKDSDPIDLHLYYNNQLIDSRHLDDDGITDDNGQSTDCGEIGLKLANLPEGVYKIELRVNDDIITKSITTKQQKLAFINKLWLADGDCSDINLWTDSKLINAQTVNPGSLQAIKVYSAPSAVAEFGAESELTIEQTYKQFSATVIGSTTELTLEKDDVILSGNGVFSFSRDSLINPDFKKVDSYLDINNGGINYILAKYDFPKEEDNWKIAQAEFDLTKAYSEDGKYNFLISIPGLRADDGVDDWVELGKIKVELEGVSLREKVKWFLNNQK